MPEMIILVDEQDNQIGVSEKLAAHQNGAKLHRAFSIFIFNDKNEMMLQQRAKTKYHFGGLWTNTCCSHPNVGETTMAAAHRRLVEEMGFDTDLEEICSFIYRAPDPKSGLTEHEFDHVFIGKHNQAPKLNPEEADAYKWITLEDLEQDVRKHPENYTPWFKIVLDQVIKTMRQRKA